jgi:tetratricopeptide (TPR) repeat protein
VALRPGELPGDADAQRWLESHAALEQAGRGEEAATGYLAATRHWPDDARFWLGLGNVRYVGRDLPAATAAFRRATELQPLFAPAWNNLAQVLGEQQCRSAALRALESGRAAADVALLPAFEATRRELPDSDGAACPESAR